MTCPLCQGTGKEVDWALLREHIRDKRRELSLTQSQVAEMASTTRSVVSSVDRDVTPDGLRKPTGPAVMRIAQALGVIANQQE